MASRCPHGSEMWHGYNVGGKDDRKREGCLVSPSAARGQSLGVTLCTISPETGIWHIPGGPILHEDGITEGSNK